MSDDLQRYRPEYPGFMKPDPDGVWVDRRQVADRIEELEATLLATCKREAATQARHDAKVTALEARADALAEENERLRYVLGGVRNAIKTGRNEPLVAWSEQIDIALAAYRATEGQSHE